MKPTIYEAIHLIDEDAMRAAAQRLSLDGTRANLCLTSMDKPFLRVYARDGVDIAWPGFWVVRDPPSGDWFVITGTQAQEMEVVPDGE